MDRKFCKKGEIILREGGKSDVMYRVLSGSAKVYTGYGTDAQLYLTEVGEGRCLGEMAMLASYRHSATVVAAEDTELEVIGKDDVGDLFEEAPGLVFELIRNLALRIRDLTLELCGPESEQRRPLKGLLGLLGRYGEEYQSFFNPGKALHSGEDSFRVCKKGEVIYRRGETGKELFDVAWGSVGLYYNYGTPEQKLLYTCGENEMFGELGVLDDGPRPFTAAALEKDTKLRVVTAEKFTAWFENKPAKVILLIQQLSKRLRNLTEEYRVFEEKQAEGENTP